MRLAKSHHLRTFTLKRNFNRHDVAARFYELDRRLKKLNVGRNINRKCRSPHIAKFPICKIHDELLKCPSRHDRPLFSVCHHSMPATRNQG